MGMAAMVRDAPKDEEEIDLSQIRQWFRQAVDRNRVWRDEAIEDYAFYAGNQWSDADIKAMTDQGKPYLTVNAIKPLINLLTGYQRLNRFEPTFLPRTANDLELCKIRGAMTKFVFDTSDFDTVESRVFQDVAIGGRGWFFVGYRWDSEILDGEACISRESPFNVYVDPESREEDLSDAEYVFRARWFSKAKLKTTYPEYRDDIDAMTARFDTDEDWRETTLDPLWFQRDTRKVRLIECYHKVYFQRPAYLMTNGDVIPASDVDPMMVGEIIEKITQDVCRVKVAVFIGDVVLEHMEMPFEHGEFPLVQMVGYYTGENNDIPAGIVRGIKDLQREANKRRSQKMHVLNSNANSGWLYEEETLSIAQKGRFEKFGSRPGALLDYRAGRNPPQRIEPPQIPAAIIQDELANRDDIRYVSGVNEALLGSDAPASTSGRAIELKQKQAVTHLAVLFDNLRASKKQVLFRLWGKRSRKGIIPQFYTEAKTFRITADDGSPDFVTVNEPVEAVDPVRGVVKQVLNDLSVGEFDIVVTDSPQAATQRVAQFYAMLEAIKLNVPIPADMLIEASDWPQKQAIIRRIKEEQQRQQEMMTQQAQAAQQQKQPDKVSQSISFKDLPVEGQQQLAAKVGIQIGGQPAAQQGLMNSGVEQDAAMLRQAVQSGQVSPQAVQQASQSGQIDPQVLRQAAQQEAMRGQPPQGQPMQSGGGQADMIRQMVQSGQANPQMLQQAVQQGLIDPQTAQALAQQLPNTGMSQEMQYQLGRPLAEDKGILPPERVQGLLQAGL